MKKMIMESLGVMLAALASGFGGWFYGRKKTNADIETSQIENAEKLLEYYKKIVDDLGMRLDRAIENLQKSELEKQDVIKRFTEATDTIHELEIKVSNLTEELKKYKQLNGKIT